MPVKSSSSAAAASSSSSALAEAGTALMNKVVVQRVQSPTFQISERIRQMIQNAELRPGMKLPPTRALASQLSVDPTAVHRSLAQLVKEGLLVRTPRVGTFVAEPPSKLRRLAFYHRPTTPGYFGSFDRALLTEITRIGHQSGFSVEMFSDTRKPGISADEPHPELIRHARTRWIQGVVCSSVSPAVVKWIAGLPVPYAMMSSADAPHTFSWGAGEMVELAIRQLVARGCRKIGAIVPSRVFEDPKATPRELAFIRALVKTLDESGLVINRDWFGGQEPDDGPIREPQMAGFGFNTFNRIWERCAKTKAGVPDGLFLWPDILAGGALMAIGMRGLHVPRDLKLLVHANAELPMFCPFPVDRLVFRAADTASALVNYIRCQLANKELSPRTLPMHIETHP